MAKDTKESKKKPLRKKMIVGVDGQGIVKPAMVMRGFRLPESDAVIFDQKVAASGMKTSEFFREAVIRNKTVVHERAKIPAINHEVLHLLLKQGNNLNQIARHLNEAKLSGAINSELFASLVRELAEMNKTSKTILGNVKVN